MDQPPSDRQMSLDDKAQTPFEYMFTDKELTDLLGCMEGQRSAGSEPRLAGASSLDVLPAVVPPAVPPAGLPLQPQSALPTCVASLPGIKLEPLGGGGPPAGLIPASQLMPGAAADPGAAPPLLVPVTETLAYMQLSPAPRGGSDDGGEEGVASPAAHHARAHAHVHARHHAAHKPPHAATRREGKPHVSHSLVEKQRRDRINNLIDELRDLVPPQPHEGPHDMHDGRRAKHVVLSDTITLVRELQHKLALSSSSSLEALDQAAAAAAARGHAGLAAPPSPLQPLAYHTTSSAGGSGRSSSGGAPAHGDGRGGGSGSGAHSAERSSGSAGGGGGDGGLDPELPRTTAEAEGVPGAMVREEVTVEEADGGYVVRVHAHDRHGLLADILHALRALPLEVAAAAATTTRRGGAFDVFQLVHAPGAAGPPPDAAAVARTVEAAVLRPALPPSACGTSAAPGAGEGQQHGDDSLGHHHKRRHE